MGLFNSAKNDKPEKVDKYERHYGLPPPPPRRRSSKHRANPAGPLVRPMAQPPMMPMGGFFQPGPGFGSPMGGFGQNATPQFKYGFPYGTPPFDMSKFAPTPAFSPNQFVGGQAAPVSLPPVWANGMPFANNRSGIQPYLNDYQHGAWPAAPQSNYGYMPAMQF